MFTPDNFLRCSTRKADKYDQARPAYSNESVDAVIEIGGLLKSKLKPTADPKPCVLELGADPKPRVLELGADSKPRVLELGADPKPRVLELGADPKPRVLELGAYLEPCVLELGAGTGKFTEVFLERCAKDVRFVATDPNPVFLEQLRQKQLPIEIMPCLANNIKLATESVDFVIAAQSFHWFADRENLVEIHRVMKKGAKFVVLWCILDPTLPWLEKYHNCMKTTYKRMNTPIPTSYEWKDAFQDSLDLFTPLEQPRVCISRVKFTLQECLSYFMSVSSCAGQTGSEKEAAENEFLDIMRSMPNFKDNCAIEIPVHTEIYWVSKI